MRVSLIDVDSKIPNLALMKISAYHKKKGDTVGLDLSNPDKIYTSIVFKKNNGYSKNKPLIDIENVFGGSGYDLSIKLPDEIEFIKPDYDLYPSGYSQGFTSRGCVRDCYFCIVRYKEGKFIKHQHPKEFHDDRFDTIMIMDNNWLADREWFFETSNWIIDKGLKVIENGLDIRFIDEKIISQLQDLNIKMWHFAFDFVELESIIKEKISLLKDCGVNVRSKVSVYVYCHDESMYNDALYRINILRDLGTNAFIMWNCDKRRSKKINDLIHWCNRKWLYWKIPFTEY